MVSKNSKMQATLAVNSVLASLLPGAAAITGSNKKVSKPRVAKAQLIDMNLKKRLELQEKNVYLEKRKEKRARKSTLRKRREEEFEMEQKAKLQILNKHREQGTLTQKEKAYLDELAKRNTKKLKSWDLEDDVKEDFLEIQAQILNDTKESSKRRSSKKKNKNKGFKQTLSSSSKVQDHRYPGLTPGLAPVGLSDEEESSDDE
ncbi:uncharacterized protein HLK63_G08481 [Nakaseomyces glabratus]|nr:uncharacterized protein GW608_G08481 [Nakaseomyces glabratus]UCS25941.1 uncharacterized protein HLK63_G08481 [Nakaseomyces glabratus]UCS31171.1 uncharacterized protein HLK64_G08481 [Nakaseomyces glabratus]UCS36400.1 uncharacterized protein HLK62_G08481 [Nakaseomyces glabratus]